MHTVIALILAASLQQAAPPQRAALTILRTT